jgi:hypothetical protein
MQAIPKLCSAGPELSETNSQRIRGYISIGYCEGYLLTKNGLLKIVEILS